MSVPANIVWNVRKWCFLVHVRLLEITKSFMGKLAVNVNQSSKLSLKSYLQLSNTRIQKPNSRSMSNYSAILIKFDHSINYWSDKNLVTIFCFIGVCGILFMFKWEFKKYQLSLHHCHQPLNLLWIGETCLHNYVLCGTCHLNDSFTFSCKSDSISLSLSVVRYF